jgi:hypothetical protein
MAIWGLILILCGLIFNSIVFFICLKSKELSSTSTFKFLAVAAINDALSCFPWNFDDFATILFKLRAPSRSVIYCELFDNFLVYTTCTYASWLLVSINFDRVLSLYIRDWSTKYFKAQWPYFFAALVLIVIVGVYGISAFKTGQTFRNENGTLITVCFEEAPGNTLIYDIVRDNIN